MLFILVANRMPVELYKHIQTVLCKHVFERRFSVDFSVRQALQMDIMKNSVLLAGKSGVKNKIEWININEIIDEFDYFRKGELFVTTGFKLDQKDKIFFTKLINLLCSCSVAALAIQTGYYIENVPAELIALCDKWELPLIQIPKSLSFSALMRDVLQEILMVQVKELEQNVFMQGLHSLSLKEKAWGRWPIIYHLC